MKLKTQRKQAARLLKTSVKRVHFDPKQLHDIKEGITKSDMRLLISDKVVTKKPVKGVSKVRARHIKNQKRKGLRRGAGSKKGTPNAYTPQKDLWMAKVRSQRAFIKEFKEKKLVTLKTYQHLYRKVKGGFFRSKRHIKLFLDDQRLWEKKE